MKLSFFLLVFICLGAVVNGQWNEIFTYQNASYIWDLEAIGEDVLWGSVFLNIGKKGIINTTDGGTTWFTDTLDISRITCMHARSATTAYCGILDNSSIRRIIKTTDGGTSWVVQSSAFGGNPTDLWVERIYFFDDNNGFAFGDQENGYNIIYTTTNGGSNWNQVPNTNIPASLTNEWPINTTYYVMGNTIWIPVSVLEGNQVRIFKSTDKGYNWTVSSAFSTLINNLLPSAIVFENQMDGMLIVSRCYYDYTSTYKIYKTSDGGDTWPETTFPLPIDPAFMCGVPGYSGVFVVTAPITNVGSGYTLDGGNSWQLLENSLDLAISTFTSGTVGWSTSWNSPIIYKYVGPPMPVPVELTLFAAVPKGNEIILSWSTATELNNLGFEIQRSIEGNEFFTIGFVNGHGTTTEQQNYTYTDKNLENGEYYYRLKQVDYDGSYEYSDVVEVDFAAFNSYLLEQNYPNPFNPTTTISFNVAEKSNVKISILNSIGEELAEVLNEEKEAGYHQVEFNAANLPSGVYFYQLEAGEFISTKKMILLK